MALTKTPNEQVKDMDIKKPTLTEIKRAVVANGGSYKKEKFQLNGNDAYTVNGHTYTKAQMVEAFMMGVL